MKSALKITALLIATLIALDAASQQRRSTLRFDREEWGFGLVKEVDGPVEHRFEFTNTGSEALVIEEVSVSCGCTSPSFTKGAIAPGGKGYVTVKYDPTDRPGAFSHTIFIRSNRGRNINTLRITGEVEPRPRTVEEDYPFATEYGIRFNRLSANFQYIEQGKVRSMTIGYVNTYPVPILLNFVSHNPNITLAMSHSPASGPPFALMPGVKGELTITIDMRKGGFYGRISERIDILLEQEKQQLPIPVTAIGIDNTDGITPETSPTAEIYPQYYDFGKVKRSGNMRQEYTMTIANTGTRPLIIRWVSHSNQITSDIKEGTVIEPGKSITARAALNLTGASPGLVIGTINMVTNDARRPMRTIRLAATLE